MRTNCSAGRARATLLCAIASISALLVVASLHLGYSLSRPVPFYDQWEFVRRIGDVLAGRFGLADLVAQHNEHRIATARVVFLLDLWLADGTGYLSIAVLYLALAGIAALLARCFVGDRALAATVFLLCFGLLISPTQWENLSSGFQVQFPFVDLFAMLSLSCLIAATARDGRSAWLHVAVASIFDLLAVFSMASGALLLIPTLWIGIVARPSPRVLSAFVAGHLVACALFFLHYVRITANPPVFDPVTVAQYSVVYLGAALRGYTHGPFALGLVNVACLVAVLASMLQRSRGRAATVDRVELFAAGISLLLLCNALITAVGRASLGIGTVPASRYALQSLLLQPALLIALWRASRHWRASALSRALFGSGLLVAGTALSLAANLSGVSRREWRDRVDLLDRAGFALAGDAREDRMIRLVYPWPETIRQTVDQFATQRLGPFSGRYGSYYRPPLNLLVGTDLDAVQTCTAAFGVEADGPRWTGVEGWAFDPAAPTGDGWIVVLDRSEHDRVVGVGRQSEMRDDVDQALGVHVGRSGFDVALRLPAPQADKPPKLTLVVIPSRADRPICAKAVDAPTAPSESP